MMRPADWSPLADSDPTPGDPDGVHALATNLQSVADEIDTQTQQLRSLQASGHWDSDAEKKFSATVEKVAGDLSKVYGRYEAAAVGVQSFVEPLTTAQSTTASLLKQAQALEGERQQAQGRLDQDDQQTWTNPDGTAIPKPHRHYADLDVVDSYGSKLSGLQQQVYDAQQTLATAGRNAASHISSVADNDGLKDSFWDKVKHDIGSVAKWLAKTLDLKALSKILSIVTAIVSVLAVVLCWVPGLGEILAGAALALSVASLLVDSVLALAGEGGWGQVLMDAAFVLTGGLARAASGGFRGLMAAGKLSRAADGAIVTIAARGGQVSEELSGALRLGDMSSAARLSGLTENDLSRIMGGQLSKLTRETGLLKGGRAALLEKANPTTALKDINPFSDLKNLSPSNLKTELKALGDFSPGNALNSVKSVTSLLGATPGLNQLGRAGITTTYTITQSAHDISDALFGKKLPLERQIDEWSP